MEPIRVVRGTGTGPTELSAYDAALADAGVHDYNLVRLSSVIPAAADLRVVETAPDLGPVGNRLTVVEAGTAARETVGAALAWARAEGGEGIFYEASATGPDAAARAREETVEGASAGVDLRDWSAVERDVLTASATPGGTDDDANGNRSGVDSHAAAVVVAAYGKSDPVL